MKKESKLKNSIKLKPAKNNSVRGKKSRAAGARFETKVRADLEKMGWIVSRWMNTVEQEKEGGVWKLVPAKRKFNPYSKILGIGTGFPDLVCFKQKSEDYEVVGVEVKRNGYLDQPEKSMCVWLLENKIFSRILIAKKGKKRGEIEYIDFKKKYESQ